jgi:cytochrome b pre-mRNA-processing protein 3
MFAKKQVFGSAEAYGWCLSRAADVFAPRFARPSSNEAERVARFEAIAVFCALITWRFERAGDIAARDDFFQHMFADFDAAMREKGVGDLKVGKEVRKLASAFYGRCAAYTPAFEAADADLLLAALGRNFVLSAADDGQAVARAVLTDAKKLAALPDADWHKRLAA